MKIKKMKFTKINPAWVAKLGAWSGLVLVTAGVWCLIGLGWALVTSGILMTGGSLLLIEIDPGKGRR